MPTPNQQMVEIVCMALMDAEIASEKEIASLKSLMLAGTITAEDWYLAVENSLSQAVMVPPNDK